VGRKRLDSYERPIISRDVGNCSGGGELRSGADCIKIYGIQGGFAKEGSEYTMDADSDTGVMAEPDGV
jgi:hypothetical protein